MNQKKKELMQLISNIEDEQVLNYLLAFVQSFSDAYISTSLQENGAETERTVSVPVQA